MIKWIRKEEIRLFIQIQIYYIYLFNFQKATHKKCAVNKRFAGGELQIIKECEDLDCRYQILLIKAKTINTVLFFEKINRKHH